MQTAEISFYVNCALFHFILRLSFVHPPPLKVEFSIDNTTVIVDLFKLFAALYVCRTGGDMTSASISAFYIGDTKKESRAIICCMTFPSYAA